jgi:hypothetical protein
MIHNAKMADLAIIKNETITHDEDIIFGPIEEEVKLSIAQHQ